MRCYPQFSFWISIALANICFIRAKIRHISVLVGSVLNCSERKHVWFLSLGLDADVMFIIKEHHYWRTRGLGTSRSLAPGASESKTGEFV